MTNIRQSTVFILKNAIFIVGITTSRVLLDNMIIKPALITFVLTVLITAVFWVHHAFKRADNRYVKEVCPIPRNVLVLMTLALAVIGDDYLSNRGFYFPSIVTYLYTLLYFLTVDYFTYRGTFINKGPKVASEIETRKNE